MLAIVVYMQRKYLNFKPEKMRFRRIEFSLVGCIAVGFSFLVTGCTSFKAVIAISKSTAHFLVLGENAALKYERGSEELASLISPHLFESIRQVESKQHPIFMNEVTIYVPGSIDSYASYCVSEKSSACVIGNRLFMSPRLLGNWERIPKILIHELSHLQFNQFLGTVKQQTNIPAWFSEGLAVYVSAGGGAENVTREEAILAIKSGRSIEPAGTGSLFFQQTAKNYKMKPHMFYRQASTYIEWLAGSNDGQFKGFISELINGIALDEAMISSYVFNVVDGWQKFTSSTRQ